jgi:homoserine kinase
MAAEERKSVSVRVPATTANLGPGFDCLGLALDLWNECTFNLTGSQVVVEVHGEGADQLPKNEDNLIWKSAIQVYEWTGEKPPDGVQVVCHNQIPLTSGLGSSAAAVLTGLLAGNALLEYALEVDELLNLGARIEGHPDNVAAALYGGLVIASQSGDKVVTHQVPVPELKVLVLLPEVDFSTRVSRQILPREVLFRDVAFNASRIPLVVDALRIGDVGLLAHAMQDRLHQPYRLPLIPGAEAALKAVHSLGIPAALSGAGPSLIAFIRDGQAEEVAAAMRRGFEQVGVRTSVLQLSTSQVGAQVNLQVDGN